MTTYKDMKEFHEAASNGYLDKVKELINKGIDADIEDLDGGTALFKAVKGGHKEVIKFLIDSGADVNFSNREWGHTPIFTAVASGNGEIIKLLICNGAYVNAKRKDGFTPLHIAAAKGYDKIVKILIENGAKVRIKNNDYETPIDLAEFFKRRSSVDNSSHHKIVEMLKEAIWIEKRRKNKMHTNQLILYTTKLARKVFRR